MKKSITVRIIVAVITIVVLSTGYYLTQKIRPSADSIAAPTNTSLLATLASATTGQKSDLPIIQLNYTKQAIETAISNYHNTTLANLSKLSADDQKIISDLKLKQSSLATPGSTTDATAFIILDQNSQEVNQNPQPTAKTRALLSTPAPTVASNFDFSVDIPQSTRDGMIAVYPKIEAFYGARSNTNAIKIVFDLDPESWTDRSGYYVLDNMIKLKASAIEDQATFTHELIHAFHGADCLRNNVWEEGMTESVTEIMLQDTGSSRATQFITRLNQTYERDNNPFSSLSATKTTDISAPYDWGSMAMYKIYLENHNFYKQFNALFYPVVTQLGMSGVNNSVLIKLVSETTPKIEGENTLDWFSHQYAFIDSGVSNESIEEQGTLSLAGENSEWFFLHSTQLVYRTPTTTTEMIKAYDNNNKLLVECSATSVDLVADSRIDGNKCNTNYFDPSYAGLIKIVVVRDGNANDQTVQYQLFPGRLPAGSNPISISGAVTDLPLANKAVITNIDTNYATTSNIKNGMFVATDIKTQDAGRYKVGVYQNNTLIKERYFNKSKSNYISYYVQIAPVNLVKPSVSVSKLLNNSFTAQFSSTMYAGTVLRLDGVPISRAWKDSYAFTISNLTRNTNYSYSVTSSNDYSLGNTTLIPIKTLSGPDFGFVKIESIGDVASGTFKRRYTSNNKYNESSTQSIDLLPIIPNTDRPMGQPLAPISFQLPITIQKVNDTTFDVIPKQKLFNNTTYVINQNVTDDAGNPAIQYNEYQGYFTTASNVTSKDIVPIWALMSNHINPANPVQIKTGYAISDIANHTGPKYYNLVTYLERPSAGVDPTMGLSVDTVTTFSNSVKLCVSNYTTECSKLDLNNDGKVNLDDVSVLSNYQKAGTSASEIIFRYTPIKIYQNSTEGELFVRATPVVASFNTVLSVSLPTGFDAASPFAIAIPPTIDSSNNLVPATYVRFNDSKGEPDVCKAPSITPAGTGPKSSVSVNGQFNVPIKITNNNSVDSMCTTFWGVVASAPIGWSIYGYSVNLFLPYKGATYRVINISPGASAVTSVTFTAPKTAATGAKVTIKTDDYTDGKLMAVYAPTVNIVSP